MQLVELPDPEDFLAENNDFTPTYPYTVAFEEAKFAPCMVMHTSGSTGIPKIVTIKQGWFCVLDAYRDLNRLGASPAQFSRFQGLRLFMPFPYFHSASINFCLGAVVYFNMTLIGPPAKRLTAELANMYHQYAGCDVSTLASSVLRDVVSNRTAYQNLDKVRYLGYGGSKLSTSIGGPLAEKTHVFSVIGLTEVG